MSGRVVKRGKPFGMKRCERPGTTGHRLGTVWECECGRRWKLSPDDYGVHWRRTVWSWFRPLDPCPTWPRRGLGEGTTDGE